MSDVLITYRGWPGHFCEAHRCVFHLNTLLECGDIRIVVSTVGMLMRERGKVETIGLDRYYETMAFHAELDGEFWDADVARQISFESDWAWDQPYDELRATVGHIAVVEEIMAKMESGGFNEGGLNDE